jgi:hypothetical protein
MPRFALNRQIESLSTLAALLAGLLCTAVVVAAEREPSAAKAETPIPDFSSHEVGWIAQGVNFQTPDGGGPH